MILQLLIPYQFYLEWLRLRLSYKGMYNRWCCIQLSFSYLEAEQPMPYCISAVSSFLIFPLVAVSFLKVRQIKNLYVPVLMLLIKTEPRPALYLENERYLHRCRTYQRYSSHCFLLCFRLMESLMSVSIWLESFVYGYIWRSAYLEMKLGNVFDISKMNFLD